ncbi:MAG: threonine--tRNA ligase, partial [Candidatus Nomurabacteria bacterium]|nr:threonine--tRNA ligase [Candidatus Nomurabacteria bacterium]
MKDPEYIEKMRHSLAHIMAAAIKSIWPTTQFGIGPAVEDGFYYDVDLGETKISDRDFARIEQEMNKTIKANLPITISEKSQAEAEKWAEANNQPYKLELIKELTDQKITFYTLGDFEDLCRGPHVEKTGDVGKFKLLRVAGAYWRGDEKRPQMQRIYGLAYTTKDELDARIKQIEEGKLRDHRKLGKELDLFCYSPLVGSGLPMFTPRGTVLRDELDKLAQSYREKNGYEKVWIPHIATTELYKVSGHLEKFPELLRFVSHESGDELALKPVNCPHHSQIYASRPRSYRDLPVKYMETTTVYRDEKKGELGGLSRVRSITQDDSHVFCANEQVEQVFGELIESAKEMYALLDMKLSLRLSFRDDGDGYIGDEKSWEAAQNAIQKMADKFKMDYEVGIGEAAMYGPKMDFMAEDAIGRKWQVATVQLDYAQPERFDLEYTAEDGSMKRPVMIHCALLGSIERFMSVLIEHTMGKFPIWCAPEQLRVIKVKDSPELDKFVADVTASAEEHGIRYTLDDSNNSVGKKIRASEVLKIPYTVVVGEKEVETG